MEQMLTNRIVVSTEICHGKPRVAGTRVMVYQVLDLLTVGKSIEEITSEDYFPQINPDDVRACVAYANSVGH